MTVRGSGTKLSEERRRKHTVTHYSLLSLLMLSLIVDRKEVEVLPNQHFTIRSTIIQENNNERERHMLVNSLMEIRSLGNKIRIGSLDIKM